MLDKWKLECRAFVINPPESILCRTTLHYNHSCKAFWDMFSKNIVSQSCVDICLQHHRFSIWFTSRLWLGHFDAWMCFHTNYWLCVWGYYLVSSVFQTIPGRNSIIFRIPIWLWSKRLVAAVYLTIDSWDNVKVKKNKNRGIPDLDVLLGSNPRIGPITEEFNVVIPQAFGQIHVFNSCDCWPLKTLETPAWLYSH